MLLLLAACGGDPEVRGAGRAELGATGEVEGVGSALPEDPEVPPEPAPAADRELGALPDGVVVTWPTPPAIRRVVDVHDAGEAARAARHAGTRLLLRASLGRLDLDADDIEVRLDEGVRVEHLYVARGRSRVRIAGGTFGAIELAVPAQHVPPPARWQAAWRVRDVTIDGVTIDSPDTALALRGQRIAVLDSRVRAERYSVWMGDTQDFGSEDLVLAGNTFTSAGPEATVRLVGVRGAIVVDNVLTNPTKHCFRVHGESDTVLFARNRLQGTGIMLGSMDGDAVGRVWLLDNEIFHRAPSLFVGAPPGLAHLVARANRVHSDGWDCFVCGSVPSGWEVGENPIDPYRAPPAD